MDKPKRASRRRKANTQAVLGRSVEQAEIDPKWRRHYEQLEQLRKHLLEQKEQQMKDARAEVPSYSLHMADAGTDNYDQVFALSRISSEQDALYEVEQAMSRIRNGTYGVCELTNKRIDSERLKAIPWTRFSAEAEKKLEQEGVVARARLEQPERILKQSTENQVGDEIG